LSCPFHHSCRHNLQVPCIVDVPSKHQIGHGTAASRPISGYRSNNPAASEDSMNLGDLTPIGRSLDNVLDDQMGWVTSGQHNVRDADMLQPRSNQKQVRGTCGDYKLSRPESREIQGRLSRLAGGANEARGCKQIVTSQSRLTGP
jgi:hypothetical protein